MRSVRFHSFGVLLVSLALTSAAEAGLVATFDDIDNWTGTGANRAALVIDWKDGHAPLAFGYRFDGGPTGEDMLFAVAAADPNLYLRVSATADPTFGHAIYGWGYNRNGGAFGISDDQGDETAIFGSDGIAFTGVPDSVDSTATSNDPADSYREGWFTTGFWSYWIGNGQPYNGGTWESPEFGAASRQLTDGDWDGFSFATTFPATAPDQAVSAIPEPSSLALLSLAACMASATRFRRRRDV